MDSQGHQRGRSGARPPWATRDSAAGATAERLRCLRAGPQRRACPEGTPPAGGAPGAGHAQRTHRPQAGLPGPGMRRGCTACGRGSRAEHAQGLSQTRQSGEGGRPSPGDSGVAGAEPPGAVSEPPAPGRPGGTPGGTPGGRSCRPAHPPTPRPLSASGSRCSCRRPTSPHPQKACRQCPAPVPSLPSQPSTCYRTFALAAPSPVNTHTSPATCFPRLPLALRPSTLCPPDANQLRRPGRSV